MGLRSAASLKGKNIPSERDFQAYRESPIVIKCPDGKERDVALMKAKQFYNILQCNEGTTFPKKSMLDGQSEECSVCVVVKNGLL